MKRIKDSLGQKKPLLSIIIPSRNETFFTKTIRDVLEKATGEIEVLAIIDGYEPPELVDDPRVRYFRLPKTNVLQKRQGINLGVAEARGKYVMWADAHCLFAKGFDAILIGNHQSNWVQVPRRYSLHPETWSIRHWMPTVDYEFISYQHLINKVLLDRWWRGRARERKDIMIDDIMIAQGSCFFMTKDWFNKMGFMRIKGYMGWGQEGQEVCLTTLLNNGRVVVNKHTWYAHLHKGNAYGRGYFLSRHQSRQSCAFSYDYWVNQHKDFFISYIEKFWPLPGWPNNWKETLWKT